MSTRQVRVIIEPDEDVYVAYCPELPGCVTYGKTETDAHKNIVEAIDLYLRHSKEKEDVSKDAKTFEVVV